MNDEFNELDKRLQQWARHTAPSADRLLHLRRKILAQASDSYAAALSSSHLPWRQTVAGRAAIALIALSVLLAAMMWRGRKNEGPAPSPGSMASLPEAHLQKLVTEIARLFDDRLVWVAETNNDVSLGIEQSAAPSTGRPRVAVRVVVLKRNAPAEPWQTVWTGDVAARAEEFVQVDLPGDGSQLKLWTYILPDGAVSVDSELAMPADGLMTWQSTSVQQPQIPLQVQSDRRGDAEFQVWQIAAVLPESAL